MEYRQIERGYRRYLSRRVYEQAAPEDRRELVEWAQSRYEQLKRDPHIWGQHGERLPFGADETLDIKFYAVGMRFHGGHVFSSDDDIRLEREDDNPHDANAIRVMADGVHVAYVSRQNTQTIRRIANFEDKLVDLVCGYSASTLLNLIVY